MKPKFLLLALLLISASTLSAQDYVKQFSEAFLKRDTVNQLVALKQWQKAQPNDPQLYINWFNYYAFKSRKEIFALQSGAGEKGGLELQDSTKKVVANMSSKIIWDHSTAIKGIAYIDTGIAKFPDRLDMRFGKVYLLGQLEDYQSFSENIIAALNYSVQIQHKWKWTGGKPLEDPQNFFLSAEQDYVVQLFNAGDSNIPYIRQIAEAMLTVYPDNVPNLSNLGISCMLTGRYDEALKSLMKANSLAPGDHIVLNNIAYCYELKKEKPNAVKYYKMAAQYGKAGQKQQALDKAARLEKQ